MRPETITNDVVEQVTDAEFEEMKDFLLNPRNFIKDNCLRLSGLVDMITDLANAPENTDLREYLTN
jgi:hypothetical protein